MDFRIPRGLPLSRSEGGATKGGGGERGAAKLSARSLCPVAKFGRKARSLQADARGGQGLATCRLDEYLLHVLDSLLQLPLRDDRAGDGDAHAAVDANATDEEVGRHAVGWRPVVRHAASALVHRA